MKFFLRSAVGCFLSLFFLCAFFSRTTWAAGYGAGSYGSGIYNQGAGSVQQISGTTFNDAHPPGCQETPPGLKRPWLYAAIPQSSSSVMLYFAPGDGPFNHYTLEFGLRSGEYIWGVENLGNVQRTFVVRSLASNTKYFFRIRTGNGCAPGEWSNELSVKTPRYTISRRAQVLQTVLGQSTEPETALFPPESLTSASVEEIAAYQAEHPAVAGNHPAAPTWFGSPLMIALLVGGGLIIFTAVFLLIREHQKQKTF